MNLEKRIKRAILYFSISAAVTLSMAGCSKDGNENADPVPTESGMVGAQPETPSPESQSLEQISAKDGEEYLNALKQQDAKALSGLMVHAENEYTEADMAKVLEGFALYFDQLPELRLRFESNQQDEDYYTQNYVIVGTKDGKERALPFQVKYAKSQGMENIRNDDRREPLYDSPLIGQYPYAVQQAEKFVQALQQRDMESLALHMGLYEDNEETTAEAERVLLMYAGTLDLNSVKVISKGYDELEEQFLFDLTDANQQTRQIRMSNIREGFTISNV